MKLFMGLVVRIFLLMSVFIVQLAYADDPGVIGPLAVLRTEYDFGDSAWNFGGKPIEVRASVHYPQNLSRGPFPLVVFLHGNHMTCTDAAGYQGSEWPCTEGRSAVPSYRGYDYAANVLASHGYIVVSISANGINSGRGPAFSDGGLNARVRLLQYHLDLWNAFNTIGGYPSSDGSLFVGKVDMQNIGTVGHSRGGEAVVAHYNYNRDLGGQYKIRAVLPITPTNDYRQTVDEVPLGLMLSYCDEDNRDLAAIHYYDDVRYLSEKNSAPKHVFFLMGATHNFYNSVWNQDLWVNPLAVLNTSPRQFRYDPHCGPYSARRLTMGQQQAAATAYINAFFRTYLGNEKQFLGLLKGDTAPPRSAQTSDIFVSYHPPMSKRLDINRFDSKAREKTNTLGDDVVLSSSEYLSSRICGTTATDAQCISSQPAWRQPHTVPSGPSDRLGLGQLLLHWSRKGEWYENRLPDGKRDLRAFSKLQFRAGVNFVESPIDQAQDFTIELRDLGGIVNQTPVRIGNYSEALFYPPGDLSLIWIFDIGGSLAPGYPLPRLFLNTVRIPLSAFSGVDLSNIVAIRLKFDQTSQGAISITDLALTRDESVNLVPVLKMLRE